MKKIKENKPLIMGGVFLLVFVMVFFARDKIADFFKGGTTADGAIQTNATTSAAINAAGIATDDTILSRNSPHRDKVRELQELINKNKNPQMFPTDLVVDGAFGAKTEQALVLLTGKKSITINEFKTLLKP
jgi:hypothetical protein